MPYHIILCFDEEEDDDRPPIRQVIDFLNSLDGPENVCWNLSLLSPTDAEVVHRLVDEPWRTQALPKANRHD